MPVNTQCLNTFKFWIKLLQIEFKTFEQVLNIFLDLDDNQIYIIFYNRN